MRLVPTGVLVLGETGQSEPSRHKKICNIAVSPPSALPEDGESREPLEKDAGGEIAASKAREVMRRKKKGKRKEILIKEKDVRGGTVTNGKREKEHSGKVPVEYDEGKTDAGRLGPRVWSDDAVNPSNKLAGSEIDLSGEGGMLQMSLFTTEKITKRNLRRSYFCRGRSAGRRD